MPDDVTSNDDATNAHSQEERGISFSAPVQSGLSSQTSNKAKRLTLLLDFEADETNW